jgi:hypothetical protein
MCKKAQASLRRLPTVLDTAHVGRVNRWSVFNFEGVPQMATSRRTQLRACAAVLLSTAGIAGIAAVAPGRSLRQSHIATKAAVIDHSPPRRDAMIGALGAANPHPSLGHEAQVFDRLVGTWDCDFSFYLSDGSVRHKKGEVLFGWILDGRAVQDIWITYPGDGKQDRGLGTSIRFFDTALHQWRVVFVGPQSNYVVTVQGRSEGKRIVLNGTDTDGAQIRWTFNDIEPDSFVWRGEKSRDGGKSWTLEEEHHMRRRAG